MTSGAIEIKGSAVLPARREDVAFTTEDGLRLVGELATPQARPPAATLVTLHPLPTAGGSMDSHVLRKAAARLPALAGLAVLRFNTRGTSSPRGTSAGEFGEAITEGADVHAALEFAHARGLPHPWLLGWSFGTELALKHGLETEAEGLILLSPPLHRTTAAELASWGSDTRPILALVPEFDDYLRPAEAVERFAGLPQVRVVGVPGAKHLWVGEKYTRIVLDEIVATVAPSVAVPLPTEYRPPTAGATPEAGGAERS